jgi:hypothetical protein
MDYADAMKIVLQGGAVRRDEWNRPAYVYKNCNSRVTIISLKMKDGSFGPYSPSNCDRLANDWQRVAAYRADSY